MKYQYICCQLEDDIEPPCPNYLFVMLPQNVGDYIKKIAKTLKGEIVFQTETWEHNCAWIPLDAPLPHPVTDIQIAERVGDDPQLIECETLCVTAEAFYWEARYSDSENDDILVQSPSIPLNFLDGKTSVLTI